MAKLSKLKAAGGNQTAFKRTLISSANYRVNRKRKPGYYTDFMRWQDTINPILLAADWSSLNMIRRFKGIALLCEGTPAQFDLSDCYQREVWVLFSNEEHFHKALELARAAQKNGATKVSTVLINIQLAGGNHE